MARLAPLAITTATFVLSLAGTALAAPRVAVLPVDFEGRVPEMSKLGLSERLVEGLAQAGFEVSTGDSLRSVLPAQGCNDPGCYRQVAAKLGLDFLVVAQVKIREKNYSLKLTLVRGSDGKPAAPEEREACDLCGIQEVGEKLDKLATSLMAKVGTGRTAPAHLTVHSEPSGASVTIDGRVAGETPLSLPVPAGSHDVALAAAGHAATMKKVTLDPGVRGLLSVNLLPMSGGGDGVIKATGVRRNLALASMGVGAAAIGGAALLLALADRKPVACPVPVAGKTCYRNAKLPAGIMIGAGASLIGAGGLILFVDWGPSGSGGMAGARQWMVSAGRTF